MEIHFSIFTLVSLPQTLLSFLLIESCVLTGFKKIECLEEYTGVKSIWLDHNYLTVIDGLYGMSRLKCLFLQNNSLTSLRGIETLRELVILDVSNNKLVDTNYLGQQLHLFSKITTLSNCTSRMWTIRLTLTLCFGID